MDLEVLRELATDGGKIILLVLDGLGDLPSAGGPPAALEAAHTPQFDALAASGTCGLHEPVGPGITPGSGPGHLGLFGYDPLRYRVGRGVLTALGIDFPLQDEDVAARGNFCTLDGDTVRDRRAGRISTEKCQELCEQLRGIEIEGVEIHIEPVREHRFLLVLRGEGLHPALGDTDPHSTGVKLAPAEARDTGARNTADLVDRFVAEARKRLAAEEQANGVLLRGFARRPTIPALPDITGMRCKAIAAYPMYQGVARLLGMEVVPVEDTLEAEWKALHRAWDGADFFFVHIKQTDSFGEDGDFDAKRGLIEEVDRRLPELLALEPDVLVVTGDHSTPAALGGHSWHPVPVLLHATATARLDPVGRFTADACLGGGLGPRFPATDLLPLAMAHAGRLEKFGA
ncbi:MAG: 2,3-bisphosphoglycerate-independent phosphoglycerate mutase [Opitutales bacterium]